MVVDGEHAFPGEQDAGAVSGGGFEVGDVGCWGRPAQGTSALPCPNQPGTQFLSDTAQATAETVLDKVNDAAVVLFVSYGEVYPVTIGSPGDNDLVTVGMAHYH